MNKINKPVRDTVWVCTCGSKSIHKQVGHKAKSNGRHHLRAQHDRDPAFKITLVKKNKIVGVWNYD